MLTLLKLMCNYRNSSHSTKIKSAMELGMGLGTKPSSYSYNLGYDAGDIELLLESEMGTRMGTMI